MRLKNPFRLLAAERRAFLARDRGTWGDHLAQVRAFLGSGLSGAEPGRAVLVLGAGTGLEVPWALAPPRTTGWDADPWSRLGTLLRHRRWAPWCFEDVTGGLGDLITLAGRCVRSERSGRRRNPADAALRLAGLLPSLHPDAAPLARWIAGHQPKSILAANLMGQFGSFAERVVESAFVPHSPWEPDSERPDPLAEALDAWTLRALRAFLAVLRDSGARLWLVHDRGVIFGDPQVTLGPLRDPWTAQLVSRDTLEVSDPLLGLDVRRELEGFHVEQQVRWLWPLAPGQLHVVEALAARP